jgi:hypothetical protein
LDPSNPFRCFNRRYFAETLLTGVLLVGLAFLGKRFPDGTTQKIAIAVAESVVIGFLIARSLIQIRRLDELGQRIHLIAIAVAFGLTALASTAAEFLIGAGATVPQPGPWLMSFMFFAWGLGVVVISRRYR